jgi:hypothetical protein
VINQSTYLSAKEERLRQQKAGFFEIEGIVYDMRPERNSRAVRLLRHWLRPLAKRNVLAGSSERAALKNDTFQTSSEAKGVTP